MELAEMFGLFRKDKGRAQSGSVKAAHSARVAKTDNTGLTAEWTTLVPAEDIEQMLQDAVVPGILLAKTNPKITAPTPGCWFGGEPTLPAQFDWPYFPDPESGLQIPMHFLLQIDLAALPAMKETQALAKTGTLFVFYEPVVAPLADEGYEMQSGGGAKILYCADDVSAAPPRTAPAMPDVSDLEIANGLTSQNWTDPALDDDGQDRAPFYMQIPFSVIESKTFAAIGAFIPWEMRGLLEKLWADEQIRIADEMGCVPEELGFSLPQDSHTMLGASQKRSLPEFEKVEGLRSSSYVLLFSIGPDEAFQHEFRDGYGVGFWIPRKDLAAMNFDRVVVWEENHGQ